MASSTLPSSSVALVKRILEEWRFSTPIERLSLVFYFRCFYDFIAKDSCLKSQLIIDAKDYLAGNINQNRAMCNFCQAVLWNYQKLNIDRPIMYIAIRGTSEAEHEILFQLRSMLPQECLKVLRQFPNYRQLAKRNPVLRSLLMRHAFYSTSESDGDLHQFSVELYEEFKAHDMWVNPNLLFEHLSSLKTEDLLLDIACNEYHLSLVATCKLTVFRLMTCFSEMFPSFNALNNILSLQLWEDKCDKYLERIFYSRNAEF
ncbi:uncharacterized protein LOC123321674 [Coccinella septempunctata]|uniref:uncharacterized protein LOC123321674 n=1 Tax=Coccinella septempunctata TaxID=41139 RepID=UPI001D087E4C|nr:uncharacterized protein LOC123321674 [Coccinella septempunctata]